MRMLLRPLILLVALTGCPSTDDGFGQGDDDDDTDEVGVPAAIQLGDEVRCDTPSDGVFEDVSAAAGLYELPALAPDYPLDDRFDTAPIGHSSTDVENQGGLAVHDFDGDGHLDIASVQIGAPPTVLLGDGALGFSPLALDVPELHYTGVSATDVDGDGATDLYLLTSEANLLLRNTNNGFEDATDALRLGGGASHTLSASWADYDRDGDLDVYLANYGEGSLGPNLPSIAARDVLLTGEDGGFVDDPDSLPASSRIGFSYVGGWFDADGDGWLDLYVVTDLAGESSDNLANHFLHNNRGTLEPAPDAGLDRRMFAMGLALDDMDGDGDVDVHVSNAASTLLARNDDGLFVDISLTVSELSNRPNGDISWATDFVDVDNDGRNELFTAFGYMPTKGPDGGPDGTNNSQLQNDTLWRWLPDSDQYEDIAPAVGLDDPAWTRTVVPADFDRDGFPEVLTWSLNEGLKLHTSGCNDNAWLRVSLRARGSNGAGLGAKIVTSIPGVRVTRHIGAGSRGSMSSQPPEALLGLGNEDAVTVDVVWPDGTVTRNSDVPTRRAIVLTQP
jgi:enediyne biosynthesis protein E4